MNYLIIHENSRKSCILKVVPLNSLEGLEYYTYSECKFCPTQAKYFNQMETEIL